MGITQATLLVAAAAKTQCMRLCAADVSVNATFPGFSVDRVIHAPTDIGLIISRVQVLSSSDTATANTLNQGITLTPFNSSGEQGICFCFLHQLGNLSCVKHA